MSKSAKANVDDRLATELYQLFEQKIHKIRAAMEALVHGVEKISTTKLRPFRVPLYRAQQAATTWSDTDCRRAIQWLVSEIHQETPVHHKLSDKLFQQYERQLLEEVGTKASRPRRIFDKVVALRKGPGEGEGYGVANMTADNQLQFQIRLYDAETEAMTWSLADMERVTNHQERGIYGITSNEHKRCKKEFSILMIEF